MQESFVLVFVAVDVVLRVDRGGGVASESSVEHDLILGLDHALGGGVFADRVVHDRHLVLVFVQATQKQGSQRTMIVQQVARHIDQVHGDVQTWLDALLVVQDALARAAEVLELEDARIV